MGSDLREIGTWVPRQMSGDHILYDELVFGRVVDNVQIRDARKS